LRSALIDGLEALGRSAGLLVFAAIAVIWTPTEHAGAQGYPARPIIMIVHYPAGGPADAGNHEG
jgi:tripartite-type tricarboxylate transporter receptor subunit TctC